MKSATAFSLAGLALLLSWLAAADSPLVSGYTSASAKSVEGIRKLLGDLFCPNLDSIDAENVPKGFNPGSIPKWPSTLGPPPLEPVRYEFWTVAGCGRNMEVLIQLWYDANGSEFYSASPPRDWLKGSYQSARAIAG